VRWGVVLGVGGALLFGDEVSFVKFSLAGLWDLAWRCETMGWGMPYVTLMYLVFGRVTSNTKPSFKLKSRNRNNQNSPSLYRDVSCECRCLVVVLVRQFGKM